MGELKKAEVRAIAERHGLVTTHKAESMEICFVPDGDYARFVEKVAGAQPKGEIVTADGEVLGEHEGIHKYTVGQRKGLQVSHSEKLYVQRIEADTNRVVVGPAAEADRDTFHLLRPHWVDGAPGSEKPVTVRIRHRHQGALGRVKLELNGHFKVILDEPARAVTPGQAAVVYEGERVLGGGWIA